MALFLFVQKSKFFPVFLNLIFIFLLLCIFPHLNSPNSTGFVVIGRKNSPINGYKVSLHEDIGCSGIHRYSDKLVKCSYVKSHHGCQPKGYISYLQLFYCTFSPVLGYALLAIWLVLLFYLLGDTSSRYFCVSLEGLSRALKLSPAVAGATLLSLGNGAPDVFSTVISFMGDGNTNDIGLNSILGGVFFVSSVVVGVISIRISHQGRQIGSSSFVGNAVFLLFCLCFLLVSIFIGKINLWGSLCFLSLYFIYVASIFASEFLAKQEKESESGRLPRTTTTILKTIPETSAELQSPLMADYLEVPNQNDGIFHYFLCVLELPLDLPRKLTIPIISEERWSRPTATISAALAPLPLAIIWNFGHQSSWTWQMVAPIPALAGIVSSLILFCYSDENNPPRKCKFIWLLEAFLLSITWTYILAQELVSLLVSLGVIMGISHSIMGLTILAWGNSLGDLVSNVTLAKNGGPGGAQTAISGCYAGPIFNIVIGLGFSLAFSCWSVYPSSYSIIKDPSIYETFGFLMVGLIWALVILTKRNMRLDKLLGIGLLVIYLGFLILKMARTVGLLGIHVGPSESK